CSQPGQLTAVHAFVTALVGPAIGTAVGIGEAPVGTGSGLSVVVVPATLYTLGFTAGGIAAGSVAAKLMSAAAIANGGGVAAGSLVAIGQSLGERSWSGGTCAGFIAGVHAGVVVEPQQPSAHRWCESPETVGKARIHDVGGRAGTC
uniref:Uncharacterized protein n=1 Tax=Amazona collaria TaxID=241587 RepID=A0A8B9EZI2_9PSIT